MKSLEKGLNYEDVKARKGMVVLEFGMETCGPCKSLKEKLDKWGESHEDVFIRYIPVEENLKLALELKFTQTPIIQVFVDGKLFIQESGIFSMEETIDRMERLLDIAD